VSFQANRVFILRISLVLFLALPFRANRTALFPSIWSRRGFACPANSINFRMNSFAEIEYCVLLSFLFLLLFAHFFDVRCHLSQREFATLFEHDSSVFTFRGLSLSVSFLTEHFFFAYENVHFAMRPTNVFLCFGTFFFRLPFHRLCISTFHDGNAPRYLTLFPVS